MEELQLEAYLMLQEIGHWFGKMPYDECADYLAEFRPPFNLSHGLTEEDVKRRMYLKGLIMSN